MSTPLDPSRARQALSPLMDFVREQLRGSTDVFLERAEKVLSESWPKIPDRRKQDSTRYAAHWLQRNKETIQSALHQRLIGSLSASRETPMPPAVDELSLMDGDTLNASLVRAKMVSRVMERGRDDLTALEERLDSLAQTGLSLNTRALAPGALADGFMAVLKDLNVPSEVQTLLLDVYGDQGVQMLLELYRGINQLLVQEGVKPELKITNRRTISHARAARPPDAAAPSGIAAVQALLQQLQRGDWQPGLFRQLLSGPLGGASPGAASMGGAAPMGGASMPGAASRPRAWMPAPGSMPGPAMPAPPAAMPAGTTPAGAGAAGLSPEALLSLTPAQLRAVDHLESVSYAHLSDEGISDRVRQEIARLVLPLLEAEVARPGEFAVDDNPARTFIRELAALGHQDRQQELRDFDDVLTTIDRIVAERAAEMESFRVGINALHTILQRELDRRAALEAQKPPEPEGRRESDATTDPAAREAALERRRIHARLEASRQRVALELNDRAAGMELDPAVAAFSLEMLGPWMMDRYNRYGATHKNWTDARAFASEFFEAARPAISDADQARRQARRVRWMREARLRLQHGASSGRGGKLLADLERYFQNLVVIQDAGAPPHRPKHTVDFMKALARAAAP